MPSAALRSSLGSRRCPVLNTNQLPFTVIIGGPGTYFGLRSSEANTIINSNPTENVRDAEIPKSRAHPPENILTK